MTKLKFLRNLRTARNLFLHQEKRDQVLKNSANGEASLTRAAAWLTPAAVKGFKVRDFPELPLEIRNQLQENVARFLQHADQVPPPTLVFPEQRKEATTALLNVFQLLEQYLPSGTEVDQVRAILETVPFPNEVLTWDFELGLDSTDDLAIWVWVIVEDAAANDKSFFQRSMALEAKIREALINAKSPYWPYVYFRTATEQRELEG